MAKKPVKYYVVDAFTDSAYKGNPAAVCLLKDERDDEWLQNVATEFNLSQTCFLTRATTVTESDDSSQQPPRFHLRWFTPVAEVKLCGHATLAASHVLFTYILVNDDLIEFSTLSGKLTAKRVPESKGKNELFIQLNFPVVPIVEFNSADTSQISKSLKGAAVLEISKTISDDLFVLLPSGKEVAEFKPQTTDIEKLPGRGLIVTGPAPPESGFDIFSRFFCPKMGINEDPVCGSAHCALTPYWSKKLGKTDLIAYQASPRSGILHLQMDEKNQRVLLQGKAVAVMEGSLLV
ncbi:hypothetical protein Leryth_004914 [Lithospermum erythrorhizon]|nr:hypothetical protein Leryth_004914 [Lithospermum erythrorhizon]